MATFCLHQVFNILVRAPLQAGPSCQPVSSTTLNSEPHSHCCGTPDSPDGDMEPDQAPNMDCVTHGASVIYQFYTWLDSDNQETGLAGPWLASTVPAQSQENRNDDEKSQFSSSAKPRGAREGSWGPKAPF